MEPQSYNDSHWNGDEHGFRDSVSDCITHWHRFRNWDTHCDCVFN